MTDFTTVLRLDPTNVNAFFNRGSAYDSLGQYEQAVADYTHALDLDSSSADPDQSSGESTLIHWAFAARCVIGYHDTELYTNRSALVS